MPVPFTTLTTAEDYSYVLRGDDVAFCSASASGALKRDETCRTVDDAVMYMRMSSQDELNDLQSRMSKSPPGFTDIPSGRLPMFYRAILAMRTAQANGRALTLPELVAVLEAIEKNDRNRDDDYYTTTLLATVTVNPAVPITPEDKAVIDAANSALSSGETAPKKTGFGPAIVMGTGGALVGGPPGAVIGFVIGLVAGRK